ncbi:MAG: diaminopimelate decarboxylase [Candidatus Omnitrophica bacterium]|nr:diaminopimelate decarboxylase [Candidatus Omnitrophota bacterium]
MASVLEKEIKKGIRLHDFYYLGKDLYCEKVRVREIVESVGTPVYIYSHRTIVEHYRKLAKAFRSVRPLICYSMKANSNLAILKSLIAEGAGLDIVSGGELYRALRAGCDPAKIVYAGVGKTKAEIEEAIRAGILLFNVESVPELGAIHRVAQSLKKKVQVSLRVNPGVDPNTHAYIATGKAESKFGLDLDTAHAIFVKREEYPSLSICGIHVHIGSQIVTGEPFIKALRKVLIFIASLEKEGYAIRYLNLGGGLGIIYSDERPQTADEFAKELLPLIGKKKFRLIFEPGRFIVGNGGILVTKVLYVKQTTMKNFAIVDAGMNDLIRPTLYDSHHEIWSLEKDEKKKKWVYDVVGPVCESGDFLARDRHLQEVQAGEPLALLSAGAYGFSMSSNYNARPRAAEVLVKGKEYFVVRKRETYEELIRGERIPSFLQSK